MLNHVKHHIYIYSYIIFSKHVPYSWAWQLLAPLHDSKASRLPPTAPWSQKSAGYCSLASLGRRCIHQCPGCKWVWYLQELWEFMGGCISWGFVISGSEDDEEQVGTYMVVDQNSFIPERPFFANKNFTFAILSRTPCLSFAGPMLANNTSYEDSFTTCQITPENHGSLLGWLLNMQLASRNPFSGQIFFCKVYWPTPFNMHFDFRPLFRITFAELSRKYPYSQTPAISRGCTEGKAKTRGLGVWLSQSLTLGNLATATRILWCPSPAGPRAAVGGSPLHIMILIPNFRETFAK